MHYTYLLLPPWIHVFGAWRDWSKLQKFNWSAGKSIVNVLQISAVPPFFYDSHQAHKLTSSFARRAGWLGSRFRAVCRHYHFPPFMYDMLYSNIIVCADARAEISILFLGQSLNSLVF
jgi:hypothetical protein